MTAPAAADTTKKAAVVGPVALEDGILQRLNKTDDDNAMGEPLRVREWEDEAYRRTAGWHGQDLIHSPTTSPVHVPSYRVEYGPGTDVHCARGGAGTTVTGPCEFRNTAESHRGLCHGGAMCAVLDDVVGWCAFCVTGTVLPWSGYTVQLNTTLRVPVPVDNRRTLRVVATIDRVVQGRKVHVTATLLGPGDEATAAPVVHATCEGLVILNRGVLSAKPAAAAATAAASP